MSEPFGYRGPTPSQPGRQQGWAGTSKMPMQALGAPPPDLPSGGEYDYQQPYQPHDPYGHDPYGPPDPYEYGPPDAPHGFGGFGRDRSRLVDWTLKGLGLLGVALVSGFLWYLIRNNPAQPNNPPAAPPATTAGQYAFQPFAGPYSVSDCASVAVREVQAYLRSHPCTSLTRSLFTTTLTSGQKVITSVIVVRMQSAADAADLKNLSDQSGTGHIKDLAEDGTSPIPNGPTSIQIGGYDSAIKGTRVVIVETEFIDNSLDTVPNIHANITALHGVSVDAARQGIGEPS